MGDASSQKRPKRKTSTQTKTEDSQASKMGDASSPKKPKRKTSTQTEDSQVSEEKQPPSEDSLIRQPKEDFPVALQEDKGERIVQLREQNDSIHELNTLVELLSQSKEQKTQIIELETAIENLKEKILHRASTEELKELKFFFQGLLNDNKEMQTRSQADTKEFYAKMIDLFKKEQNNDLNQQSHSGHPSHVEIENGLQIDKKLTKYDMSRDPRGICLIINNSKFDERPDLDREVDREGSEEDVAKLTKTFTNLKFKIRVEKDKTKQEMLDLLKIHFTDKRTDQKTDKWTDHTWYDCFVCIILTHGKNDGLYGTDWEILSIPDILKSFENTRSLEGKPKLFFFQACRNLPNQKHNENNKIKIKARCATEDGAPNGFEEQTKSNVGVATKYSSEYPGSHFLVGYATLPGRTAFLSKDGSYYIKALCNALDEHANDSEINEICTIVNNEICRSTNRVTGQPSNIYQTATYRSTLKERLYFFPK